LDGLRLHGLEPFAGYFVIASIRSVEFAALTTAMEAYRRVKANRGAAGIDNQSIEMFERNFKSNLYWIWNRMSSGERNIRGSNLRSSDSPFGPEPRSISVGRNLPGLGCLVAERRRRFFDLLPAPDA
jgi:hypothetical protein